MSLFKARSLWSGGTGGSGEEEETLGAGLAVGRLVQDAETDQIVLGSLTGHLRIYDLKGGLDEGGLLPSKAEQLLLETKLDYPVVGLAVGAFVSASATQALAVLHPRKLSVFVLGGSESDQVRHGSQYTLRRAYEHVLQRSAFNMVWGAFGGVEGRDFVCVQSLDGCLTVLEQESLAFARFLPGGLLPGPLTFAAATDCIVTVSSSWEVEAYKYQNLAVAAASDSREEAAAATSGKRVVPDWTVSIGEPALDIQTFETPPALPSLVVLGERSVLCFTQGGQLRFITRLDYRPLALRTLSVSAEGVIGYCVVAHTRTLCFYSDSVLCWAAQLAPPVVSVAKAHLGEGLEGALLTLTAKGSLEVAVLGTAPTLYGLASNAAPAPLDFPQRQAELRRLQERIRTAAAPPLEIAAVKTKTTDDLKITVEPNTSLDHPSLAVDTEFEQPVPSITVKELSATFFVRWPSVPVSLRVELLASYTQTAGIHKLSSASCQLPLSLVVKPCVAAKTANHKLTLDSTRPTIYLNTLFPEMVTMGVGEETAAVSAMGFVGWADGAAPVSVLVSNNVQKYRIQSDALEWCWLLVAELERRLAGELGGEAHLSFSGTLPLPDYFVILDHHFEIGRKTAQLEEMLGQRCAQLRAVEKQLLSRFRDTTPSPLAHLDGLVEMTYRQVMKIADSLEELEERVRASEAALDAVSQLCAALLRLSSQLDPKLPRLIRSAMVLTSGQRDGVCWEERAEAGLAHILRLISPGPSSQSNGVAKFTDTKGLKKSVAQLVERLTKQANVVVAAAPVQSSGPSMRGPAKGLPTIMEDSNLAELGDEEDLSLVPTGAAFADTRGLRKETRMAFETVEVDGASSEDFGDEEGSANGYSSAPIDASKLPALSG